MIGSSKQASDPSERKVPGLRDFSGTRLLKSSGSSATNTASGAKIPASHTIAAVGAVIFR
jgi:hypothetical protein